MTLRYACSAFATADDFDLTDCGCSVEDGDDVQGWLDAASDILYYLSDGYVTGLCTRIVRPVTHVGVDDCLPTTIGPWAYQESGPHLMLRGPNPGVDWVKINGAEIDPSEYALVDDMWLVRRSGSWPTRNDVRLDLDQTGTWGMQVTFGETADMITAAAGAEMACEMARAALGLGSEVFAPGVVTANVQGATVAIEDAAAAVAEGRELLPKTARFISMYGGRGDSAVVFSPEIDTYRLVSVAYFS
jgi:hypothetical protein